MRGTGTWPDEDCTFVLLKMDRSLPLDSSGTAFKHKEGSKGDASFHANPACAAFWTPMKPRILSKQSIFRCSFTPNGPLIS